MTAVFLEIYIIKILEYFEAEFSSKYSKAKRINLFCANGPNQIPEFGALGNLEDLKGLIVMDAQHKIKENIKYPAVLVRTGMNDPRVIPRMPAKFAATMQNNSTSGKPVLFYVDYENGHFTQDKNVTVGIMQICMLSLFHRPIMLILNM